MDTLMVEMGSTLSRKGQAESESAECNRGMQDTIPQTAYETSG